MRHAWAVLLTATLVLVAPAIAQLDYPPDEYDSPPPPPPTSPYGPCPKPGFGSVGADAQNVSCDRPGPQTAIAKLLEQLNSPLTAQPQTSYAVCDALLLPPQCNSTVGCKFALHKCGAGGLGGVLNQRPGPGLFRYFMNVTLALYMDTPASTATPRKLGGAVRPVRHLVGLKDYSATVHCGGKVSTNEFGELLQSNDESELDCSFFDPAYGNFFTGGVQCCEQRL